MGTKASAEEKYLKATFKKFDKDGSGTISREELREVLYTDGLHMTDEAELDNIITMADKNNDGEIDYQELIELMQKGVGGVKL